MPTRLPPSLFIVDQLIRRGHLAAARRELRLLLERRLPRAHRAPAARCAWRLKEGRVGVALLHRLVRPPARGGAGDASDEERAVYAACLAQLGATAEALALLSGVDAKRCPEALFYRASTHVGCWEYAEALPLWRKLAASEAAEKYRRTVARVNATAALVFLHRHREAADELTALRRETERAGLGLLYCNVLELDALSAILEKRWADAELALERAARGLGAQGGWDALLLRKWQAVLALLQRPGDRQARTLLAGVRAEAERRGHWETLRDCDHLSAVARKDEALLWHVYFGTPFAGFRELLLRDFGAGTPPSEYRWRLGGKGGATFDLGEGALTTGAASFDGEASLHRLLAALCLDFYRPIRLAELHARLYPSEQYHPETSPGRVSRLIVRLRRWVARARLPLRIALDGGGYRVAARAPFEIRVPLDPACVDRDRRSLERLRARWPQATFSSREAGAHLHREGRTIRRLLREWVDGGELEPVGAAASTRYRFTSGGKPR